MDTTKLQEVIEVFQRINKFLILALPTMGPDALKLALAVSGMVAKGGATPIEIDGALNDLQQLLKDFDAAKEAVQAT